MLVGGLNYLRNVFFFSFKYRVQTILRAIKQTETRNLRIQHDIEKVLKQQKSSQIEVKKFILFAKSLKIHLKIIVLYV